MRILFRSQVILIAVIAGVAALGSSPALAGHSVESTVSATVTPAVLSVTATPTSVDYEVVELSATGETPTPLFFTATNNGSIIENIEIRGADTTNWTLEPTAGANQYVHRASKNNFSPQIITLTTENQELDTGVAVDGTVTVHLNLDAPTSSTTAATQTAVVTVIATAP